MEKKIFKDLNLFKKLEKKISLNFLVAIIVFVLVFFVYLFTLAPTIFIEDSPEYITAIAVLGIAHPSGYPLYILLGKLFTLIIPFGSIAWKVNLMSAFFGAATCSLVYLICQRLVGNRFVSFVSALILGFSEVFWSQSVVAEVYTLNAFFVALLILILIVWQEKKEAKYLLWFAFLYGLSLTNHQMMMLLAPAFVLFILLVDWKIIKNWRLLIKLFLLFLLGLSLYLYLPLRGRQNPSLNWGRPQSLSYLWDILTRRYYNDLSFDLDLVAKSFYFFSFLLGIIKQFYSLFLFLAIGGLLVFFKKNKRIAWLTLAIFLFNSLGIIFLRHFSYSVKGDYIYRVYYLPCYIILVIWFAVVLAYFFDLLPKVIPKKLYKAVLILMILATLIYPTSLFARNYRYNNYSNFWLNYDYYKCVLESLEPNSVLLSKDQDGISNDTELFSLLYLQMVEKKRTDVFILDDVNLFYKKINFQPPQEYYKFDIEKRRDKLLALAWDFSQKYNFPLYTGFPVSKEMAGLGLASKSNGAVFKVFSSLSAAKADKKRYALCQARNLDEARYQEHYGIGDVVANIFYRQAFYYFQEGRKDLSLKFLVRAINLDNETLGEQYRLLVKARGEWEK